MSKLIISGLSKLFSALLPHLDQNDHVTECGGGLSKTVSMRAHVLNIYSTTS